MSRLIVVGAGPAGMATALFSARRGHQVVLVERDHAVPDPDPESTFEGWERPGTPQARHSHKFLGRSCQVLREEAPEVMTSLLAMGAEKVPLHRFGLDSQYPHEFGIASRRLVYEMVLRQAVLTAGVQVLRGVTVTDLLTTPGNPPRVQGVALSDDGTLHADLVVDATGRRAALAGLLPGVIPEPERDQRCRFVYLTRHYRLRPGQSLPPFDRPLAKSLGYGAALAFPADNGTYSISLTVATNDPYRRALAEPDIWEQVMAAEPHADRWVSRGTPISDILSMGGIRNRWQRLVSRGRPVVGGMVLVGDAAIESNPTYGRGVSMALAHAQQVAQTAERAAEDPVAYVADLERWTDAHHSGWLKTQIDADGRADEAIQLALKGEAVQPPSDPFSQLMGAIEVLAGRDPSVARALGRLSHLLSTPKELLAQQDVMAQAAAYIRSGDTAPEEPSLSRAEFERIANSSQPVTIG